MPKFERHYRRFRSKRCPPWMTDTAFESFKTTCSETIAQIHTELGRINPVFRPIGKYLALFEQVRAVESQMETEAKMEGGELSDQPYYTCLIQSSVLCTYPLGSDTELSSLDYLFQSFWRNTVLTAV